MIYPLSKKYPLTQGYNDSCCRDSYKKYNLYGHNGWDIGCPSGTKLLAPHTGQVIEAQFDGGGYGNYIKIENDLEGSVLAHLNSIAVKVGQMVKEGDEIGVTGSTGNVTGPHLHWGYYRKPRDRTNGLGGFIDQGPYLRISELEKISVPDELTVKEISKRLVEAVDARRWE